MIEEQLDKINHFTRRKLTADEVYIFSVILCDNEIDRDYERFSDNALNELKTLFIGKTGIFDHDTKSSNQSARIFDTELITDNTRLTSDGQAYKYLKAHVYMVRTDENEALIREIDGGIKKEVSISCTAIDRICSVCGCDKKVASCFHIKGKKYNGKICHTILDGISDAYEWSFVAVPAQINAGVTKYFSLCSESASEFIPNTFLSDDDKLRRDIRKAAFICGGKNIADATIASSEGMNTEQLINLKKSLEEKCHDIGVSLQLVYETQNCSESEFSMK